ncbi:AAA-domain-containing protein [Xylariaceae sp. FL1272]|nr:AAA-domain-containing protein [Xylariaceae sp. FL1272]
MKDDFKTRIQPTDVEGQKNPTRKNAAKVFLHPSCFTPARFTTGGLCQVEVRDVRYEAVAWPGDAKISSNIACISRVFQAFTNIELGEAVRITPGGGPVRAAGSVVMRQTVSEHGPLPAAEASDLRKRWQVCLEIKLETAGYIMPGCTFDDILMKGQTRSFVVDSVNGSPNSVGVYDPNVTVVEIADGPQANGIKENVRLDPLPNMVEQTRKVNLLLDSYGRKLSTLSPPPYSCGVIIDGSNGTGKTLLLDHIAASKWGRVIRIKHKDKPSTVKDIFEATIDQGDPTIILIDDLMRLIGKGNANRADFLDAFGEGLDSLAHKAKENNLRPNVLVIATCLDYYDNIPYDLQRPERFPDHIRLTAPDANGRRDIIQSWASPIPLSRDLIPKLVERTHAFTGGDLATLHRSAAEPRQERLLELGPDANQDDLPFEWQDFQKVFKRVRPSAMKDIDLKPPTVNWTDIGGYEDVKGALQQALQTPKGLTEDLWIPTKGILLYGPPGCSKTMTAQAMATETGYNFLAVKGGELLNMYVGETERSIRNIFKRAAEAAPSIIFFDEIDSLAGSRSTGQAGGGGVQAVTTLLTEMDGFEERGEVFVLAATNRPDCVDPALMRPGRFDETIYVPLPDVKAREAIITRMTKKLKIYDVDVEVLGQMTDGYSGAEICGILGSAFKGKKLGTRMDTLKAEIAKRPKSVTSLTLSYFENWRKTGLSYTA